MIKLFLPVLFPSWRFFSSIGPSPRIELGFVAQENEVPTSWVCFQPIPQKLPLVQYIVRLLHNPQWNELLFINTCAEHLFTETTDFYREEIARRLLIAIKEGRIVAPASANFMRFRIRAIHSEPAPANQMGRINDEIFLQSRAYQLLPVARSGRWLE